MLLSCAAVSFQERWGLGKLLTLSGAEALPLWHPPDAMMTDYLVGKMKIMLYRYHSHGVILWNYEGDPLSPPEGEAPQGGKPP